MAKITDLKRKFAKPVIRELSPEEKKARAAKKAKIRAVAREFEAKKRELGMRPPSFRKGFAYYGLAIFILLLLGGLVVETATETGGKKRMDRKTVEASKSVEAIAEALGRFKFHTGVYPAAADGLGAIFRNDTQYRKKYPGWLGRYAHPRTLEQTPDPDPWKHPYVYEPPAASNEVPVVLSLGPDGVRGTADDIRADAAFFVKPFRDTTWTNDWVPFWQRGIIVVPSKKTGKTYRYEY